MIYVILDAHKNSYEERIMKGPYVKLYRGYRGEIEGEKPDGEEEVVF